MEVGKFEDSEIREGVGVGNMNKVGKYCLRLYGLVCCVWGKEGGLPSYKISFMASVTD